MPSSERDLNLARLRQHWGLVAAAVISATGYGALLLLDVDNDTLRAATTPRTIWALTGAFAGFLLILWWTETHEVNMRLLWLLPIGFRVALLFTTPTLSDDVYRYLWDGHVSSERISPYRYTVNDPALDSIEIPIRQQVNNSTLSSPYLPAAHAVFLAASLTLPSSPIVMQVLMTAFDLLTAVLLAKLLALAQLPPHRIIIYLWNPLVIVEMAHGAHLDGLMVVLSVASLAIAFTSPPQSPRSWVSPVLFTLAVLTRPIPLLLAPILFWRWSWAQRFTSALLALALVVPFGIMDGFGLVGENDGTGVFGSARVYSQEFRFNSGLFHWAEAWLVRLSVDRAESVVQVGAAACMVSTIVIVWLLARTVIDARKLLRLTAVPLAAYVLLTPVLHPWYVIIVLAFAPFIAPGPDEARWRWMWLAPLLWLCATLPVSYLTYQDPLRFRELEWVRRLEWLPTLTLLAFVINYSVLFLLRKRTPNDSEPIVV